MNIVIKTIPYAEMRYPTCGDYWRDERDTLQVRISEMNNPLYVWLVLIHELVEICLILFMGISIESIDQFDIEFEKNRKEGNTDEPGDDDAAPYKFAHCAATGVERILAAMLFVSWSQYDAAINALGDEPKTI